MPECRRVIQLLSYSVLAVPGDTVYTFVALPEGRVGREQSHSDVRRPSQTGQEASSCAVEAFCSHGLSVLVSTGFTLQRPPHPFPRGDALQRQVEIMS